MIEFLNVNTGKPLKPIEKNIWRMVGLLLNRKAVFSDTQNGYSIQCNGRTIETPQHEDGVPKLKTFSHEGKCYGLYCTDDNIDISINEACVKISSDIFTHAINLVSISEEENTLKKDRCGLMEGSHSNRGKQNPAGLISDVLYDTARLLSDLFGVSLFEIAPKSPYIISLSFDVDGFLPGQIEQLLPFLSKWEINNPTFMVMAFDDKEKTIYDPQYSLQDKSIKILFDSDVEIGLHSSYLAHDNPEFLYNQKRRLELASGRKVLGHRSHYYRFSYPRSWIHQMRTGFAYDASMGYPDLPGFRNGSGIPMPLHDPDGFNNMIWTISTGCLDQHFFNDKSYLYFKEPAGIQMLDGHLKQLKQFGGILSLDWHVHGFNSEHFPGHYKPLEYILDRAEADGACILGLGEVIQRYNDRWKKLYSDIDTWQIRTDHEMKTVDFHELNSYKSTFFGGNLGAVSIDNAAMSLISVIPQDVETLLDIGSGPGYISSKIPSFIKVLCMDLDEDILKYCTKPTCVGDITDIPLENKSVDMAIACDVMEHLKDAELEAAIFELKRVSRKYLYIQTPLNEDLSLGTIRCEHCGHQWHINYHRQSFTYNRLMNLLGGEWVPQIVNFTGDLSYYESFIEKSILKKELGMSDNSFVGHACPKCGNKTTLIESELNDSLNKIVSAAALEQERVFPLYSEIGVLFEHRGKKEADQETVIRTRNNSVFKPNQIKSLRSNEIDFSGSYYEADVFSRGMLIPQVLPFGIFISQNGNGVELVKADSAQNASVSFSFPMVLDKGDAFSLTGTTDRMICLSICMYTSFTQEIHIGEFQAEGDFNLELVVPQEVSTAHAFLRLSWAEGELKLSKVKINSNSSREYYEYKYSQQDFSHIEYSNAGVLHRWLLSSSGTTYFSHNLCDWIDNISAKKEVKPAILMMDYINKINVLNKELLDAAIRAKQAEIYEGPSDDTDNVQGNEYLELTTYLVDEKLLDTESDEKSFSSRIQSISLTQENMNLKRLLRKAKLYIMMRDEMSLRQEADRIELEKKNQDMMRQLDEARLITSMLDEVILKLGNENFDLIKRLNEAELLINIQSDIITTKRPKRKLCLKRIIKGALRGFIRSGIKIIIATPILFKLFSVPIIKGIYNRYIKGRGLN